MSNISRMKPELIAPAGDWSSLRSAIEAKANAIYFGLKELNMRINAPNFRLNDVEKISNLCHNSNVKAYLTLNTIVFDNELKKVEKIIDKAKKSKIDAVICWDLGILKLCKRKKIPVHLSTQASVANSEALKFYEEIGVKRIVLARELSLRQIKEIKKKTNIEIECFIHGAMCVSVSGRCLMSQFLFGKSANRGVCLQPCRRGYNAKDERGKEIEVRNNYVLSAKDICTMPFIDKLVKSKINAFKIEGRNKQPEYVKTVTSCYRKAIDSYFDNKLDEKLKNILTKKLKGVYNRGFSSGFYLGRPINEWTKNEGNIAKTRKKFIGVVENYYKKIGVAQIFLQAGKLKIGDEILVIGNKTGCFNQKINSMELEHEKIKKAEKGQSIAIKVDRTARENDKVYLIKNTSSAN